MFKSPSCREGRREGGREGMRRNSSRESAADYFLALLAPHVEEVQDSFL
jgi:hypothetical protein